MTPMSIKSLHLPDLLTGAERICTGHLTQLHLLSMGVHYEDALLALIERGRALPGPSLTSSSGRVEADALREHDRLHDGYGAAIWHQTESYQRHPEPDEATGEAARRIRVALVASLSELRDTYLDQANRARQRRALLDDLAEDLARFPLAGGASLRDWAERYISAGERIAELLIARAAAEATQDSPASQQLRSDLITLLTRLRRNVADELALRDDLPPDLDARLFDYIDLMIATRARAASRAASAPHSADDPGAAPDAAPPAGEATNDADT